MHIKGEKTAYTNYEKKTKASDLPQWPPKFWKFHFTTEGTVPFEVAFTDARRFGRVRLVDCPGSDIKKNSPLVENGPDPVQDLEIFTEDYLRDKMRERRMPVKAFLLKQDMISGIGNWVADETLYQAKIHPEQYCNELDDAQITTLYEMIRHVCQTAVDKLADSDQFPEDWIFHHRWGKGKLGQGSAGKLPNGEKLEFITVGGRTSCYAPGVQKKTGKVVAVIENGKAPKKSGKSSKKTKVKEEEEEIEEEDGGEEAEKTPKKPRKSSTKRKVKEEEKEETPKKPKETSSKYFSEDGASLPKKKRTKVVQEESAGKVGKPEKTSPNPKPGVGLRRSARLTS